MKKFITLSVSVLLTQLLSLSPLTAQTVFSRSSDSLVVFYPSGYDPTQTQPSFIINNEPVVTAGKPAGWRISPVFTSVGGDAIATLNCGRSDFYGSGEVIGNLRRNNTTIVLWNTDNYQYTSVNSGLQLYQSHPWVMGVRADGTAFGVIADNTWKSTLQITDSSIIFNSQGPGFRVLVFEAANPQAAVKELTALTNKISLPPLWSLGYQQCRYSYTPDTQVKGVADSFRLLSLPCDVIWMDIDYMNQYEVFTFNSSTFPHPDSLNAYLHRKNFKSVWMIDPGVKQLAGYSIYDSIVLPANNFAVKTSTNATYIGNVWPGACVFPDFTMPTTRAWWSRQYKSFMALGMDGVWNDMNEPSVFSDAFGSSGTMPTTNLHAGGGGLPAGTHLRYHNVFGRLMVQATRDGIMAANPTKRPFVLSRSNVLGGQQYAATWTGDNQATTAHMQLSVPMILTMGLSGQPIVGADVTGYAGNPTGDLVGQWMALGTFYPFYRNHSEKGSPRREPWAFGAAIQAVCKTALQRRYRLLPYLYTLTQEATTDGLPIMRPLFMEDPTNVALRSQQQAFMLGDILLITPKWATGVVKPTGTWTSISLVGENSVTDAYQPNIEIKAGSILPLGQIIQSTADYTADSITLIVSLDDNDRATGSVYSDAGDGYAYQTGSYLMRSFNIKPLGTDSLILNALVDSGSLSTTGNRYNVGIVTAHTIVYTGWTSNNVIKIPKSLYGASPYTIAATIPGTIQAENYDKGGQAIAYNDADTTNNGGQYRPTEGVDLEACTDAGGGYDMGWTAAGEWEKYSVNVLTPGTYTLTARVASPNTGEKFHVKIDGTNISGNITVPNTGGWATWGSTSVTTPALASGAKTMSIMIDSAGYNINYLTFTLNSFVSCPGAVDYLIATTPVAGNTYQWQVNTGSGYNAITANSTYANVTKDTLSFLNASSALYGNQYRCMITNGATITYSTAYTLTFSDTWTGAESTAWEDVNNWSCGAIPDALTDVTINSGVPNYPVVNSSAICRTLTVNTSASLQVSSNHSLTITH